MILYVLQVHHRPRQVARLLELLAAEDNQFIVNVDPASDFDAGLLMQELDPRMHAQCVVRSGRSLTWGGISQVHAWLDVFRFALDYGRPWDHLVNLSGECIPLVPQATIQRFLDAASGRGVRAHLGYFGPPAPVNGFVEAALGSAAPAAPAVAASFFSRVPALVDPALDGVLNDRSKHPLFNWNLRGSLHVTDAVMEKRLVLRALLPFEAQWRREQTRQLQLRGGRAWYLLRRDAVRDILQDPLLPRLLNLLQNFLCPDELFLQSLLANSEQFRPEHIAGRNAHYLQGEPVEIKDELAPELFASGAFFARKIWYIRCPHITGRAQAACRGGRPLPAVPPAAA